MAGLGFEPRLVGCKGRNHHIKPQKCLLWVHNKQAVGRLSSERPEVRGGRRPGGTRPECWPSQAPGVGGKLSQDGTGRNVGSVASCTGRTSLQPPLNSRPPPPPGGGFSTQIFQPHPSPPWAARHPDPLATPDHPPASPASLLERSRKPAVALQTPPGGNSSLWDGENVLEH